MASIPSNRDADRGDRSSWTLIRRVTRYAASTLHPETRVKEASGILLRGFLTRDATSTSSTLSCG